jgi:uncharacterized protein (DUF58 family)
VRVWPRPSSREAAPGPGELARAARILLLRSRREAAGALAGAYRSAFHGGGIEFEESRPYAIGDDARSIDWNATARSDTPYVKRFREERDQTVRLLVDVSGSMRFGSAGRSKAALASHAAALLASAASYAGDRVGLTTFADRLLEELPPGRGQAHAWRAFQLLAALPPRADGPTRLGPVLGALHERARRRSIVFVLSDFRDDSVFGEGRRALVALARHHEVIAVVIGDPRERTLPAVGALRLVDPEAPGPVAVLRTGSRARSRYAAAAAARERELLRHLRGDGVEMLMLQTDREPLRELGRFFGSRATLRRAGGR